MDDEQLLQLLHHRPFAAYHEAGHVVVALSLGVRVSEVQIDEQGRGRTGMNMSRYLDVCQATSKSEILEILRRTLGIHVAGYVANHLQGQWGWFARQPH